MCLVALFYRVLEDAPVILGANREEAYARGGEPPQLLGGPVPAAGGVDPVAGGTWLGVNARGVIIAVTNRLKSEIPKEPRSRGMLARELLGRASAAEAAKYAADELNTGRYGGCNVLCVDAAGATVIHGGDWLRVRPLPPGLHILTSHDVDDASDRRLGHAHWWLCQRPYSEPEDCVEALQELCAQPGNPDPPMSLHGDKGGTVSSSILCLRRKLAESVYLHAQGPPDRTPYADYSHLLAELAALRSRR
jgi:uncharacterized protein with NRDE domain